MWNYSGKTRAMPTITRQTPSRVGVATFPKCHLRLLRAHKLSCFKATMRDAPRFPVAPPPESQQSRQRRQRWRRKMETATRGWEPWHRCGPTSGAARRATRSGSGPRFCTGSDWPVQVKTTRKGSEGGKHTIFSVTVWTSLLFFWSFFWLKPHNWTR